MRWLLILALVGATVGCGTSRVSDTNADQVEATRQALERLVPDADTTLYLVAFDIQSGQAYGTVWTSTRAFDFVLDFVQGDDLTTNERELTYSAFLIEHLVRWDTSTVRAREAEQGALLGGSRVQATLVVGPSGGEPRVFTFDEFGDSLRAPYEQ
ncbi:MAG: hypothetical protein AAF624_05335 [Bacteroidota bacterium]